MHELCIVPMIYRVKCVKNCDWNGNHTWSVGVSGRMRGGKGEGSWESEGGGEGGRMRGGEVGEGGLEGGWKTFYMACV